MLIGGSWDLCDDGAVRPVIRGEILAADGSWLATPFRVDPAADRTVFSAAILAALHLQPIATPDRLGGVGGTANSVVIATQVRLTRENGSEVVFHGQYAAVTDLLSLDMSVLGRDIMNLFAAIIDRPGNVVWLLRDNHHYTIAQT
jgi:hypothetical protein